MYVFKCDIGVTRIFEEYYMPEVHYIYDNIVKEFMLTSRFFYKDVSIHNLDNYLKYKIVFYHILLVCFEYAIKEINSHAHVALM